MTVSLQKPFLRRVPDLMRPFAKAGKVDTIFRPRALANGMFATPTGYGASFSIGGIDSEGLDRLTLDHVSKQIAIANRTLPEDCLLYEYLITAKNGELPARPILNDVVRQQAQERVEFLRANAKFRSVRLIVAIYVAGKVTGNVQQFAASSRSALRRLQNAALLYERQLRMLNVKRLSPDEVVRIYSYLLNLDRSLMTRKAAPVGQPSKKLGRVHIGLEGEYLRVGKKYYGEPQR